MTFLHPKGLSSINPKDAPCSLMDLKISAPDYVNDIYPALDDLGIFLCPWTNTREGSRRWNLAVASMQGQDWIILWILLPSKLTNVWKTRIPLTELGIWRKDFLNPRNFWPDLELGTSSLSPPSCFKWHSWTFRGILVPETNIYFLNVFNLHWIMNANST